MLKYMILIMMSVFGAASIALAGMPITTMIVKPEIRGNGRAATRMNTITVAPGLRQIKRPTMQLKKPNPIPKAGMRRLPGHRGMISTGRRPPLRLITPPSLDFGEYQPGLPNNKCADLSKLMVIRAEVVNFGGPLLAHRAKIYLRETNGAHLYSPKIPIPPLAHNPLVHNGQGENNAWVDITIPVGTTEAYRGKLPGVHHLNSYFVEDGKVTKSIDVSFAFPPGYCQPKKKSATQGLTIDRTYRPLLNKLSLGGGIGNGSVTHGKMPDLIPQVSNPFNGIIKVKNQGGAMAVASKLTVNCKKIGGGPGGDCPSTKALDSLPSDASGALLESVPPLAAGQVYTIHLPVQGLKWGKGPYLFTYKADATHAVAESNESNNKLVMNMGNALSKTGSFTHGKMPDLIPQVSNPFNGIIKVRNIGGATAGASKLTVNCEKIGSGFVASVGDCPSTQALNALPSDSSGALLESVPALYAGQVYTISLPVQGLKWNKGKYRFTYKADATHAVTESNESNNVKTMVRQR